VNYLDWLRWWQRRGAVAPEEILLAQWDPLGIRDDPE
jgi:hypothetical protein